MAYICMFCCGGGKGMVNPYTGEPLGDPDDPCMYCDMTKAAFEHGLPAPGTPHFGAEVERRKKPKGFWATLFGL